MRPLSTPTGQLSEARDSQLPQGIKVTKSLPPQAWRLCRHTDFLLQAALACGQRNRCWGEDTKENVKDPKERKRKLPLEALGVAQLHLSSPAGPHESSQGQTVPTGHPAPPLSMLCRINPHPDPCFPQADTPIPTKHCKPRN